MSAAFFQIPKTAIFNEQKAQGFLPVRSLYSDPKIYMEPPPIKGIQTRTPKYKNLQRGDRPYAWGRATVPGEGV